MRLASSQCRFPRPQRLEGGRIRRSDLAARSEMRRTTARILSFWLLLVAAAHAESSADDETSGGVPPHVRQRLLEQLPDVMAAGGLDDAAIDANDSVAAVRLPRRAGAGAVYVFERDAGGADRWGMVAEITAPEESHFGDALMLGSETLLVASPDTAGAGLGPGVAFVFQRHVGGPSHWGLVARLVPAPYPSAGAVEIRRETPSAGAPDAGRRVVVLPPIELPESGDEAASDDSAVLERASPESPRRGTGEGPAMHEAKDRHDLESGEASADGSEQLEPSASDGSHRFIVVGNMREKQGAVLWATDLRHKGYRSEIYRNTRGYFVVTLDRLPLEEARSKRIQAVSAGDAPEDSYLLAGTGFREKIGIEDPPPP